MNTWTRVIERKSTSPQARTIPTIYGVTMPSSGAAIVGVTLTGTFRHPVRSCVDIERLPFDVGKVAAAVGRLQLGPRDRVIVDAAGAGMALWIALGSPRDRKFTLYTASGRERQKLVDPFPAMMLDGSFSFAGGLDNQEPMLKALANYRREVLDDGIVGNELAIALFLAVSGRPAGQIRIY